MTDERPPRLGDSTLESEELQQQAGLGVVTYRNLYTGQPIENPEFIVGSDGRRRHVKAAPPLTVVEQQQAAATLQGLFENTENHYPQLTSALLRNPDSLWLLPELQLMLQDGDKTASYDFTGDLASALLEDPGNPGALNLYHRQTAKNQTQQLFWSELGNRFEEDGKAGFVSVLAKLSADGADNVASLALAWAQGKDLEDEETRSQLFINIWQWGYERQQSELADKGLFGFLDLAQETIEDVVVRPIVNAGLAALGSPEEAARRKGLTLGQQTAYQMGLRPPDAGQFGSWMAVSGGVDAMSELGLDPLSWLAGVGAGLKASRTIALAPKAAEAGRVARAGLALLPKFMSGSARAARGGRVARVIYSFSAKPYDELFEQMAKSGVAQNILDLVKADNMAKLSHQFPQFARMSDDMWSALKLAETPEEAVEVFRHGNLVDVLKHGDELDRVQMDAAQAWADYRKAFDTAVERGTIVAPEGLENGPGLLKYGVAHRELAMEALNKQTRLDTLMAHPSEAFVIFDIPQRAKKVFNWRELVPEGAGRFRTGFRQAAARVTPGQIPGEIDIFNTRKGAAQIRLMFEHYGVEQSKVDDLVGNFMAKETGERQIWFWDEALPALGEAIGVPALQYDLVTFYKKSGIRQFASSGLDMWEDPVTGIVHRSPLLPIHLQAKIPLPVRELDQIVRRSRSIANRSQLAKSMGWRGRGLGDTRSDRLQLVQRFRAQLIAKGVDGDAISDEQLWNTAYSYVDRAPNAIDGRGWWSGTAAPRAGSVWDGLHRFFTKNMLIFRPFQWAWRVALLEEPIRASIFNMSSMYRNPLGWMADLRDAHYLSKLKGWRETNLEWADEVYQGFVAGTKNIDEGAEKLRQVGLLDDIFPDGLPGSMADFKEAVASFLDDAVRNRTRVSKLSPIQRVPWAVKNRSANVARAEAKLKALGKPSTFDLVDDLPEIQQKMMHVYLAGTVGASDVRNAQWVPGMLDSQARNYGVTLGGKMIELVEDPMGRIALRRLVANLRSTTMDGTILPEAIVNHSRWQHMRGILRQRFPEVTDDLELAARYMDELLEPEAHEIFKFAQHLPAEQQADIIEDFIKNRHLRMDLDGSIYDINLRSGNYGKGVRDMGELVTAHSRSATVRFAENLPAPAFDPRFMANDEPNMLKRLGDKVFKLFGESVSQTMNRRPAWIREYDRWATRYRALGIPENLIDKMATEHASQMVNHVYYNIDEAPFLVQRLNRYVPFFGATYEVLSAWTYKMPVEVGGSWPMGVGEFGRKFQRLLDGFVNMGLVTVVPNDDGTVTYDVHWQPRDEAGTPNEIGQFLRGMGYSAIHTLDSAWATILGLQEGLGLREAGYHMTVGNPLDFTDYGVLSFAQANLGMSPTANIAITKLAALIPGAADGQRTAIGENESLSDLAERLDEDPLDIVRLNRGAIIDSLGKDSYNALLAGVLLPDEVVLPAGLPVEIPNTNVWTNVIEDFFQPFGAIEDPKELLMSFLPGVLRWGLAGFGIQNQPTDDFYAGEYGGLFAGLLPNVNQSQMSSQISEAFMYVESHKRYPDGEGRFERILRQQKELAAMIEIGPSPEADALKAEIDMNTEDYLTMVQQTAGQSLLLRSLTGSLLPTSPGHVRQQQEIIQSYWNSGGYADSVRIGTGDLTIQPFKSMTEVENFFGLVGAWLSDPTGDAAKAKFAEDNPTLLAYITPKTFYGTEGVPPEVGNIEEYQRQIESGERVVAPLHVTMFRYRSSAIQADYYNKFIAAFGNDPVQAAANALNNYEVYQELQEEKSDSYQAMYMQDDMNGGLYDSWQKERYQDDSWSLEQITENLNTIRDNLSLVLEMEDNLDIEMDLDGIRGLRQGIKAAIAEISGGIRAYNELAESEDYKNPYEDAVNRYFTEVYIPYQEGLTALYDQLDEKADSEQQSLMYEQIKLYRNQFANTTFFLDGNTTAPFPSPMDIQWTRRTEEEKQVKIEQWLTRPLLWLDQDSAQRIVAANPVMSEFLPTSDEDFAVYTEWTITKEEINEMWEAGQITEGQKDKMQESLEGEMHRRLLAEGRGGELAYMDMTPYEQLELSGALAPQLGMFGDYVRYYKEVLAVEEESPGSARGRILVAPLYEMAKSMAYGDPDIMNEFRDLGENLLDKTTLDNILPWLFFNSRVEQ